MALRLVVALRLAVALRLSDLEEKKEKPGVLLAYYADINFPIRLQKLLGPATS